MDVSLILLVALALVILPYVLWYKFGEKKDWGDALKGGLLFTGVHFGLSLVAMLLLVGLYDSSGLVGVLFGVGVFALTVFVINRYFSGYKIKHPVWLYLFSVAYGLVLTFVGILLLLGSAGSYMMSFLPMI